MRRIIFSGEPGARWVNNTDKVRFQFVAALIKTCGACLQYHMAIGPHWGIPIHKGCRCRQVAIQIGAQAPNAFVDFREILDGMSLRDQVAAIGLGNYRLLKAGVVTWEEIVMHYSVHSFEGVVALYKISLETMLKAGIPPGMAKRVYNAVHTPEQDFIRAHREKLLKEFEEAGVARDGSRCDRAGGCRQGKDRQYDPAGDNGALRQAERAVTHY